MKGDEVVGLCVLCSMDLGDGEYFLYLTEQRADGREERTWIPVYEASRQKPDRSYPVWLFRRLSVGLLEVRPSLWDKVFGFHNAARWSVRYVEVSADVDEIDAGRLHRDLNLLTGASRRKKVYELLASGVLS